MERETIDLLENLERRLQLIGDMARLVDDMEVIEHDEEFKSKEDESYKSWLPPRFLDGDYRRIALECIEKMADDTAEIIADHIPLKNWEDDGE